MKQYLLLLFSICAINAAEYTAKQMSYIRQIIHQYALSNCAIVPMRQRVLCNEIQNMLAFDALHPRNIREDFSSTISDESKFKTLAMCGVLGFLGGPGLFAISVAFGGMIIASADSKTVRREIYRDEWNRLVAGNNRLHYSRQIQSFYAENKHQIIWAQFLSRQQGLVDAIVEQHSVRIND